MNKNYRGVLKEIFGEGVIDKTCQGEWVNIHSHSTMKQDESTKMMVEVLKRGYTLDIITKDGKRFEGVTPAEVKIKICYNCSVTAPDNGIITWRPHISDFRVDTLHGELEPLSVAGSALGWTVDGAGVAFFTPADTPDPNLRNIKEVEIDGYDVIKAFGPMGPALQDAVRTLLYIAPQKARGDRLLSLRRAIELLEREIQLEEGK